MRRDRYMDHRGWNQAPDLSLDFRAAKGKSRSWLGGRGVLVWPGTEGCHTFCSAHAIPTDGGQQAPHCMVGSRPTEQRKNLKSEDKVCHRVWGRPTGIWSQLSLSSQPQAVSFWAVVAVHTAQCFIPSGPQSRQAGLSGLADLGIFVV